MKRSLLCVVSALFMLASHAVAANTVMTIVYGDTQMELTAEDLAALPQSSFTTSNEFIDGAQQFSGPLAKDVVALVADDIAGEVTLTAANDYAITVPVADFGEWPILMATHMSGKALSRRDFGPVWLVYPMDDHPELRNPVYVSRMIWQLVKVEVQ